MPKKQNVESAKEQSDRFEREVQRLIDAGELNPTEADRTLDELVRRSASLGPKA
jgi:polyhydroxyalkanoate synthesis regulator phasin